MCDPYNHNPFEVTPSNESRSEADANRLLVPRSDDWELIDPDNEWGTWIELEELS